MATEITASFSSGNNGDKSISSCIGVATQGLGGIETFFYTSGTATLRQNTDGTIDIKINNMTVTQDVIYNNGPAFRFQGMYASKAPFGINGAPEGYGIDKKDQPDLSEIHRISNTGTMTHTGNPGTCYGSFTGIKDDSGNDIWFKVANNIEELQPNFESDEPEVQVYLAGFVDFGTAPDSTISIDAKPVKFRVPSLDQFIDYFPWERRINGTWMSLNRAETGAGLYKMDTGWTPLKNGGETNHGFRYNNGWQVSPKSGQGA